MANKETVLFSENRRAKRIPAPVGTTAILRNTGSSLDMLYVRDISVIGMLVCDYNSTEIYPINSSIDNIFIDIPPSELSSNKRICLLIDKGRIVRSFFDHASSALCHGIELTYENSYVKGKIESLVNNI